ncbi:conserved hypothetical protein [Ricinus communis]|uniref:Uncharacterized protein n=1 Tax=Ricinus communis TaxID=3988 RepID=B9RZC2_RICCO|nr:conserved hypothetical protein [Ricinus communis]
MKAAESNTISDDEGGRTNTKLVRSKFGSSLWKSKQREKNKPIWNGDLSSKCSSRWLTIALLRSGPRNALHGGPR